MILVKQKRISINKIDVGFDKDAQEDRINRKIMRLAGFGKDE